MNVIYIVQSNSKSEMQSAHARYQYLFAFQFDSPRAIIFMGGSSAAFKIRVSAMEIKVDYSSLDRLFRGRTDASIFFQL